MEALQAAEYLLLQRWQGTLRLQLIDAHQYALLQACREDRSLADIAASLDGADAVLACLPEALTQGWIGGFHLKAPR